MRNIKLNDIKILSENYRYTDGNNEIEFEQYILLPDDTKRKVTDVEASMSSDDLERDLKACKLKLDYKNK